MAFLKPTFILTHLADSLARLASSPSGQVSDFPLGKSVSGARTVAESVGMSELEQ
jgi:hypothetical protein